MQQNYAEDAISAMLWHPSNGATPTGYSDSEFVNEKPDNSPALQCHAVSPFTNVQSLCANSDGTAFKTARLTRSSLLPFLTKQSAQSAIRTTDTDAQTILAVFALLLSRQTFGL